MFFQDPKQKGFTLIELVAVIVLLSILSVVALSRLGNLGTFEGKAYFDEVTNALRYAQKLAQSTGCNVQVTLTSAPASYKLHQGASCSSTIYSRNVLNPVDRTSAYQNINPPDGVTIIPVVGPFVFTPHSTVTGLAGNTSFNIGSYSFTLYQNTGLIHVH